MKKSIISIIVGLAWMLTPQVSNAQEQDELLEKASRLYQQPQETKDLLEETYHLLEANPNTINKKWDISEAQKYKEIADIAYQLIEVGNRNGKIDNEELLGYAKEVVQVIDEWSAKSNEFNNPILLRFRNDKGTINKALEKRKVIQQFVPYLNVYTKVVTQNYAATIINLYAEQKKQTANVENIKKYREGIARMQGNGKIAVAKTKRDYKGDMPFREYYKLKLGGGREKSIALVSSFLDEKFLFDKELHLEKLAQLEQSEGKSLSERPKGFTSGIEDLEDFKSMQPTDTFGLCIDVWKPESGFRDKQPLFINLRTGKQYLLHEYDLNNMLESITYLAKSPSIPDFKYDPSYSLTELFKYEWYYPESPEKMCKALEGLEVYRTDINDYDVITSVNVRRSDDWNGGPAHLIYDVKYQKGGYDKNRWEYDVFSVKWYEQLKKCIGMKVIFCDNGEERILYQDFFSNIPYWTLESVELGNLDGRTALVATIKQGQKTERLDAVYNGLFLTRNNLEIFPKDRNMYSHRLLPYDYVKKHAVKAPESVKSELSWFVKTYQESMMQSFREIWVGLNVSLFLAEFPKAKLVKNTVSGGKTIKIYHVNGNEFVFKDGVCTSVTKI